jgi:serine/threonine-protein kinase PpkA
MDTDDTEVNPDVPKRRTDKDPIEVKQKNIPRKWPFRHDDVVDGKAVFDGYTILAKLGGGGMSTVFLAQKQDTNTRVALKLLHGDLLHQDVMLERFKQEYSIIKQVNHPNIVTAYDQGLTKNNAYMTLEVLSNKDLKYRNSSGLTSEQIFSYSKQILAGLMHLANEGIVHRDLKPTNILFRDNNTPVITDFGVAKRIELNQGEMGLTQSGLIVGTMTYASPEQLKSETLDTRSDQYSFGVLLYEMLTGKRIFTGESAEVVAMHHVHSKPEPLPEEYEYLQPVLDRLLAKNPHERYSCFEEVSSVLEGYIELYS